MLESSRLVIQATQAAARPQSCEGGCRLRKSEGENRFFKDKTHHSESCDSQEKIEKSDSDIEEEFHEVFELVHSDEEIVVETDSDLETFEASTESDSDLG